MGGAVVCLDDLPVDVKVDPALFAEYRWSGSTIEYHRAQIREFHGFREVTVGDEDKLIVWLAAGMCPVEMSRDRLRSALLARCREVKAEPSAPGQVERLLGAAESMFERDFTIATVERLPALTGNKAVPVGRPQPPSGARLPGAAGELR